MTVLNDAAILRDVQSGYIGVEPFDRDMVQPASIDVRLGVSFVRLGQQRTIATRYYDLEPGGFVLATTVEYFTVPTDMVARIEGKSSLGRLGLLVHSTAGFVDPGFSGELTLEMANLSDQTIRLIPGQRIAQVSFSMMVAPAERPYSGKYQGQRGATPSRVEVPL